jgi:hypothetical protein
MASVFPPLDPVQLRQGVRTAEQELAGLIQSHRLRMFSQLVLRPMLDAIAEFPNQHYMTGGGERNGWRCEIVIHRRRPPSYGWRRFFTIDDERVLRFEFDKAIVNAICKPEFAEFAEAATKIYRDRIQPAAQLAFAIDPAPTNAVDITRSLE